MSTSIDILSAAQSADEALSFIEAFAKINIDVIRQGLGAPIAEVVHKSLEICPDWDDVRRLEESGLTIAQVDNSTRTGMRYLHIDVALAPSGIEARKLFLGFTGLSLKLQKSLFPELSARKPKDLKRLTQELASLNAWLDWVRRNDFDPAAFITYQRSLGIHGQTQNLSGAIGAAGAAIAFIDALRQRNRDAIVDSVGDIPPDTVRSPQQVFNWLQSGKAPVKALLLKNGRALVFASSKDANVFKPLEDPFTNAQDALTKFNAVRNDQAKRSQVIHEYAVGEVKTATDLNNLHERMGLASRETQTELRTDRFLMMAVLNPEILEGGIQRRVMNNRDLTRFSHIFNLHHCWGWDGGRTRHPEHWNHFLNSVSIWCGV